MSATDPIDQCRGNEAGQDAGTTIDDVDEQGVAFGEACRLPHHSAVVENDIDTNQLLETRQPDPQPNDWAKPGLGSEHVCQLWAMVGGGQGLGDLIHFGLSVTAH